MTVRIAVAVFALAASAPAAGQEWLERTYVEARTGVAAPRDNDLHSFDPGMALELAAGWRAHRNVAVEVAVSRFAFRTPGVVVAVTPTPDAGLQQLVLEERLVPVMLDAKGVLPLGPVELHALAGVGACFSRFSSTLWTDPRSDNAWAFEAGAGASLRFADRVTFTAGARWLRTEATYHDVGPFQRNVRLDSAVYAAGFAFRL